MGSQRQVREKVGRMQGLVAEALRKCPKSTRIVANTIQQLERLEGLLTVVALSSSRRSGKPLQPG